MKKRKLILLTDYYPFTLNETFLENEIPYLYESFDVTIISGDKTSSVKRIVPEGVQVYRIHPKNGHSKKEILFAILCFFFSRDGFAETVEILKTHKLIKERIRSSLYFYLESRDYFRELNDKHITDLVDKDTLVYSYWSTYALLAFTQLKKKRDFSLVTRLHGYDLYNERYMTSRQPFKKQMHRLINAAIFVSEAGLRYYSDHFAKDKLVLCRLGTNKPERIPTMEPNHIFTIVSCSNVISIKRVDIIVQALRLIGDIRMKWIHFGDGDEFERIKQLAKELPENIEYEFVGRVPNRDVIEYYSNHYIDCFVTASSTEGGCPVSIMEALSYGIPIISTAVGGIPEMLSGTNNIVLNEYLLSDGIAKAIQSVYYCSAEDLDAWRKNNMIRWEEEFNNIVNCKKLVALFKNI